MRTDLLSTFSPKERANAVARATALLKRGEVVALPTETVYGLAADALNAIAVAKIFEVKERPHFDPLIVHLPDRDWLEKIAALPPRDRRTILRLADQFWPGPFTMVLPKRKRVPEIVTAGLDTVAVRISAHPVFAEVVRAFGKPLAAPSANRFGRISPTTAQHVLNELDGRIPLIVDAGPTEHGIESTIVTVRNGRIEILRRGPITAEELRGIGFQPMTDGPEANGTVRAPGQLPSHYAPRTPLKIIDAVKTFSPKPNRRAALLAWHPPSRSESSQFAAVRILSERQDLREAAANLFRYLRELDALGVDLIVAERVPSRGLGEAIMDRLQRAAHPRSAARCRRE
jgi:L-threonylcarbamoyladenylate synthase